LTFIVGSITSGVWSNVLFIAGTVHIMSTNPVFGAECNLFFATIIQTHVKVTICNKYVMWPFIMGI
jgi:hypothetical protein